MATVQFDVVHPFDAPARAVWDELVDWKGHEAWIPATRVAVGPVRLVKCDIVGTDHVRLIANGDDGRSFKGIAFRAADSEMGQALLHGSRGRRLWLAGRVKIDDWGSRPQAELHLEDAAFAD